MQAMMNIQVLNGYEVKKIVTACPHCFNTLKNEYPELGGNYEGDSPYTTDTRADQSGQTKPSK